MRMITVIFAVVMVAACAGLELLVLARVAPAEAIAAAGLAHGYYSASFGVVKAILKGAAGRYKKLARKLIKTDDAYRGALGYKMMGKFYYMAPFPLGSLIKSERYYKKALEKDSSLCEPRYYLGMIYLKRKKSRIRMVFE